MKGTARRGSDRQCDKAAAEALRANEKERAENLMIVDLIRNDLSRIAAPGSVKTPSLFDIETYPTLHQLTSTVTARLDSGRTAVDVLASMFPFGPVTCAPTFSWLAVLAPPESATRGC